MNLSLRHFFSLRSRSGYAFKRRNTMALATEFGMIVLAAIVILMLLIHFDLL